MRCIYQKPRPSTHPATMQRLHELSQSREGKSEWIRQNPHIDDQGARWIDLAAVDRWRTLVSIDDSVKGARQYPRKDLCLQIMGKNSPFLQTRFVLVCTADVTYKVMARSPSKLCRQALITKSQALWTSSTRTGTTMILT